MTARKHKLLDLFTREERLAFKHKKAHIRPVCPSCGTEAPLEESAAWGDLYGHRCPHGEPCQGWGRLPAGASTCAACTPAKQVVNA